MLFQVKNGSVFVLATMLAIVLVQFQPTSCLPTLFCTKEYLVNMFEERVINRTKFMGSVNLAKARAEEQLNQAESSGALHGLNDEERLLYFQKLMIKQINLMRQDYEERPASNLVAPVIEKNADDLMIQSCFEVSQIVDQGDGTHPAAKGHLGKWDPNAIIDAESLEEIKLIDELKTLEEQAKNEAAKGWSLSQDTKDNLRFRTRAVMRDLLSNELRQLAMAMLSAYLSGGNISIVFYAVGEELQHKIVAFILNSVVDIVSSIMGRQIDIRPAKDELNYLRAKDNSQKKSAEDIESDWQEVDKAEIPKKASESVKKIKKANNVKLSD